MFLFSMMFTIMLAMSSCSAEETELSETIAVNQINSLTIKKLQEYNEVMMAQKPHTRAINGKGRIACADIYGAIRGMNAGRKLAAIVGLTTGGTGSIATIVGCGILRGALSSYQVYRSLNRFPVIICFYRKSVYRSLNRFPVKTDDFFNYSLNLINHNVKSDTMNFYRSYIYEPKLQGIKLPSKCKDLQAVGYMHNQLILGYYYANPSPQAAMVKKHLDPLDNWTPPTLSDKTKILSVLNGKDFKSEVDKEMVILNSFVKNGQFDVDNYMKANPIGDVKVENAIKEYFKLFTTYPENVDDLVKITNDYIEIIETGNEFTEDEKAMIYAGLMVSIYSPQIWNGFE